MIDTNAPLPGQTAPVRSAWYDLDRLAELRDRHQQLLERARAAKAAVKECARMLGMVKSTAGTHPAAIDALNRTPDQLAKLTVGELANLQISPSDIQRIQTATKRHGRLAAEAEHLRLAVSESNKFQANLEAFAKARNL